MKYSVISTAYIGEVIFSFDDDSVFNGIEIKASLTEKQLRHFIANIPYNIDELLATIGKSKLVTLTPIQEEVTFEMFWKLYNDKSRSSKIKSEKIFNRFSQADRIAAFNFYPTYMRNKGNAEKKYCETYLNAQLWKN